jgi:integrase
VAKESLTAKQVEHIKPGAMRSEFPAGPPSGLYLALHPTGKKSWAFRYRWRGIPTKITFAKAYPDMTLAAARAEAQAAVDALAKGENPAAISAEEKKAEPNAAVQVAEEWLARDVRPRVRTWYEIERVMRKEILPACKGKLITEIGRADVLRLVDWIVDRGAPIAANETLSIIKRWLNWCVGRGYLESSPVGNVPAPSAKKSRDRVLSDEELRDVWHGGGSLGYPNGAFVRLLILLAQRRGEVAGMRWRDVDLDRAIWTLPAEQTKAGRVHDVPLSSAALEIIKALPRFEGPHVFTSGDGAKPINSFSKCKVALDKAIAKIRKDAREDPIADYTMHDFRRTASTHMAKAGVAPHVLSALLNHSPGSQQGVTAIYNRFRYLEERREALENWGSEVLQLAKQKRKTHAA